MSAPSMPAGDQPDLTVTPTNLLAWISAHPDAFKPPVANRGTIQVDTRDDDGRVLSHMVGEGEMFVVPAGVAHSPLRPADTWGLVIERPRRISDLDVITWFCPACGNEVNRSELQVTDIDTQLHPILDGFTQDEERRTCTTCGTVHPVATDFVLPDGSDTVDEDDRP